VLSRLVAIIQRLHGETAGFLASPNDAQLWYDRGYANGVVHTLDELGYAEYLDEHITRDPAAVIAGHEVLAWGQAYRHGFEVASRETREVIGPAPTG
jgi:hypothetical protein